MSPYCNRTTATFPTWVTMKAKLAFLLIVHSFSVHLCEIFSFLSNSNLNSLANRKFHPNEEMNSTINIEVLPPEMICELFNHLPLKDLSACSLVNKRWYSIYTAFKLHSLVVSGSRPSHDIKSWYDLNQPVREAERCGEMIFCRLAEKPLLFNLRYLALCGYQCKFNLNKLNRFKQLVHLEISARFDKLNLKLPKLKVLAYHKLHIGGLLSVDCPELSTLLYYTCYEGLLKEKQPTIRKLETNLVGPHLAQFKSVECLITREFEAISKATLVSLPRLRELRYDEDIEHSVRKEFNNRVGSVVQMKRTLSEFVDMAKRLRGRDFQFTFCGFQLTNVNVEQIDFGVQVDGSGKERVYNEYVYLKNYHLIEPGALHFVWHVNYTLLLTHVTGEFPRCFFQKFTRIWCVRVDGAIEDLDHFLGFLKSLRSLRRLELFETKLSQDLSQELSQEFYDQLPESARSLAELELGSRECKLTSANELQLNFNFIGNLSGISHLKIHQPLSFGSCSSLVRLLGKLTDFSFYVRSKDELHEIQKKKEENHFSIINNSINSDGWFHFKGSSKTENPDKIVTFFERLQSGQALISQLTSSITVF